MSAHQGLAKLSCLSRLFADDYRRDELASLLAGMLAIHLPLEHRFGEGDELAIIGYRPRVPLLIDGLEALEWKGNAPQIQSIADLDDAAGRLGALYVVEGSILGGQVIRRRLMDHFGPDIAPALDFYTPYGGEAGPQWSRFRRLLTARLLTPEEVARSVLSASATFAYFERELVRLG